MPIERQDRRRWPRRPVELPCKLVHPLSGRFASGITRNLSEGGALLTLTDGRPLLPGEPVNLAIAFEPKPIIKVQSTAQARVVWADLDGPGQRVALEFLDADPKTNKAPVETGALRLADDARSGD